MGQRVILQQRLPWPWCLECLALKCLSIHGTETLDAQLLPGLLASDGPGRDVLVRLFASGILRLCDDLAPLVLHEIGFGVARCSLLLVPLED